MSHYRPPSELVELAARLADGKLDERELEQFHRYIDENRANANWFVEWMELNALLHFDFGSMSNMALTPPALLPTSSPHEATRRPTQVRHLANMRNEDQCSAMARQPKHFSPSVGWLAVAGSVLLAVALLFGFTAAQLGIPFALSNGAVDRVAEREAQEIATISGGVDAEFDGGVTLGSRLSAGRLKLIRGIAQVMFDKGAVVVLEGPAELELVDSGACRLISGSISADILPDARGFSVDVGDFKVVESDARFGMRRSTSAVTEVHVFGGELNLVGYHAPYSDHRLAQGQALRFNPNDTVTGIASDPSSFVTQQELSRRRQIKEQLAHARWTAYSRRWLADPSVVLRYDFSPSSDGSAVNAVDSNRHAAKFGQLSPRWIEGRWSDKPSMLFDGRTDVLVVEDHSDLRIDGSMSLAVWFKERAHSWGPWNRLVGKGLGADRNYGLWIGMHGRLIWQVCPDEDPKSQEDWDKFSLEAGKLPTGKWHLVVGIVDERELRVYVNGELRASGPAPQDIAMSSAPLTIGFYDDVANHNGYFCGEIDELILLNRAMTDAEVVEMYEAGRPEYMPTVSSPTTAGSNSHESI